LREVTGGAAAAPLLALCAIQLLDELDTGSIGVLAPEIRDWFGLDLATITLIGSLRGLGHAVLRDLNRVHFGRHGFRGPGYPSMVGDERSRIYP